jgi:hypothetical protein
LHYHWTGPAGFDKTTAIAERDPALVSHTGTYTITVTDDNGCFATTTVDVEVNQPNLTDIFVNDNSLVNDVYTGAVGDDLLNPGTDNAPYASVQKALSMADPGDKIWVDAGTYVEVGPIVISEGLDIEGAGKTLSIIKPDQNYLSGGWITVSSGIDFDLLKVQLDGTGQSITKAILHQGSGSVTDCKITQIKNPFVPSPGDPLYDGTAIQINSSGNVDITNCVFTEIGRNGILADGCTGTYSGNNYTGKGAGDWMDYFILSEYGDNVLITDNTISDRSWFCCKRWFLIGCYLCMG